MTDDTPSTPVVTKHLRRVCPVLIVADAKRAAGYYRDRLGFAVGHVEGGEFAIVARDGCQVFLKRGVGEAAEVRNRHRCDNCEFYDLFIHCDSMSAFDALRAEFEATRPEGLSGVAEWGGMRVFSLYDLDGYKLSFARSV